MCFDESLTAAFHPLQTLPRRREVLSAKPECRFVYLLGGGADQLSLMEGGETRPVVDMPVTVKEAANPPKGNVISGAGAEYLKPVGGPDKSKFLFQCAHIAVHRSTVDKDARSCT